MQRQYAETVLVSEPFEVGRDEQENVIRGWTPPREEKDVTIYRAPVEFQEAGRENRRIYRCRLTFWRWPEISEHARITFDGNDWNVTQPPRRSGNAYVPVKSCQITVERTVG